MPHLLLLIPTTSYRTGDFLDATQRLGVHDIADQDITPRETVWAYGRVAQRC